MSTFSRISATEAKTLIDESNAIVVDVRDERSFSTGHIPQARKLDNNNVQQFVSDTDFKTPVIVYCYHGNISQSGASFIAQQGFDQVYSLDGGFTGWKLLFPDQIEH